jgi:serine/threonine-protein kinase SRPK3
MVMISINPGTRPEPLSLSGMQGFFPARPGLFLNDRYEILRKLGQGQFSTTWLVSDSKACAMTYRAVKILTVEATEENEDSHLLELEVLKRIRTLRGPHAVNLPYLFDHFAIKGPHGKHLCLVLPVLSTDISSFRKSAPSQMLKSPTVKVIVAQVVSALVVLHDAAIVHGDLKPDNLLFGSGTAPKVIQELLKGTPPAVEGGIESAGKRYPIIRTQPVPNHFKWDDPGKIVELYFVQLVDFGNGHSLVTSCNPFTYTTFQHDGLAQSLQ